MIPALVEILNAVTQLHEPLADPDLALDFLIAEVPLALAELLEGLARVARAMKDFSHPGHGRGDVDLNRAVELSSSSASLLTLKTTLMHDGTDRGDGTTGAYCR